MTKHEYICAICDVVRSKSDCFKRKVGAVFVNADYEILATGYNNPPRGFEHCDRKDECALVYTCGDPCTRNIHAELNGLTQAAKRGISLQNSMLFCTYVPCRDCARLLINLGIKKVYAKETDKDRTGAKTLEKGNVQLQEGGWA